MVSISHPSTGEHARYHTADQRPGQIGITGRDHQRVRVLTAGCHHEPHGNDDGRPLLVTAAAVRIVNHQEPAAMVVLDQQRSGLTRYLVEQREGIGIRIDRSQRADDPIGGDVLQRPRMARSACNAAA